MCESSAYLLNEEGAEELFLKDVATIKPQDGGWLLVDIFGQQKLVTGEIVEMDLLEHRIIFRSAK